MSQYIALFLLVTASCHAFASQEVQDEACEASDIQEPSGGSALLQLQAAKDNATMCSYQLVGDQDGSKPCAKLSGKKYTSGKEATLDEAGYQQTAKLCCHHEMSLFVRREIKRQGLDVCDLSDLHGFVHWYDCPNDKKSYAEMKNEIAGVMSTPCPWLGHLPACPKRDPKHCGVVAESSSSPAGSLAGDTAPLSEAGYAGVALACKNTEMEKFVRREIGRQNFHICDEGAFQGFLAWFDCKTDDQSYEKLKEGLVIARSGLPPMCPWLGSNGKECPPKGHNCPVVELPEPEAHRRRSACR